MKNCAKIIAAVMVLLIGAGYAAAYSPSDFTDVFTNPKLMWYCSQSSSVNGVAGVSGVCAGGLYYYNETVTGFRDQNNPNDSKRLCQNDTACNPVPTYMMIGGTYNSNNPSDGKVPPLFRVYIPPGITGISMSLYVSPVRVAVVARMGQPPANPSKPISEYGNIQSVGLNLDDLMNGGELWTRNADGNIQIFYGGGGINQTVLQSKGFSDRWLYLQVVKYDATWLETLTFNMTIGDMTAYKNWYNSVNWDCYNNPGNAAMCSSVPSYTVTFQAGTGGNVNGSSNTSQTVSQGNSTTSVTANPDCTNDYKFFNWTGPNGFTSTSNPLIVTNVTSNATYTANFQKQQPQTTPYTVTANSSAGGTVIPAKQTVMPEESATFIATENPGYTFASWTGCTSPPVTSKVLTVSNVKGNLTCTASFQELNKYNITAGSNGIVSSVATNGLVSISPTTVYEGQVVLATPKTTTGTYRFVKWTGTNFESRANPLQLLSKNLIPTNITANFEPVVLFLTEADTEGSILTGDNTATASPKQGYSVKWTDQYGNDVPSNGNTITITSPTGNSAYVANFYKTPHKITLVGQAVDGTFYVDGKSLTVDSNGKTFLDVPDNGSFTVTVIPTSGKKFSKWIKKVVGFADVEDTHNPLKVEVTSDMEIIPTLEDVIGDYSTVNFIAGTGGSINGTASQTVSNGATFTKVVAVANCGYKFSYWQEEPAETSTTAPLNSPELALLVNKNKTYTAHFMPVVTPDNDGKLGLEEVIYILQVLAGLRP